MIPRETGCRFSTALCPRDVRPGVASRFSGRPPGCPKSRGPPTPPVHREPRSPRFPMRFPVSLCLSCVQGCAETAGQFRRRCIDEFSKLRHTNNRGSARKPFGANRCVVLDQCRRFSCRPGPMPCDSSASREPRTRSASHAEKLPVSANECQPKPAGIRLKSLKIDLLCHYIRNGPLCDASDTKSGKCATCLDNRTSAGSLTVRYPFEPVE